MAAALGTLFAATACPEPSPPDVATPPMPSVLRRTVQVAGSGVALLEAGPAGARRAVLLLHGAAFRATTWEELGTLQHLARAGVRAIAVDLPGYGDTPPSALEPAPFLAELEDALALERPVVVAPSMSGRFALPLLASEPARFGGLVAVAPAGTEALAGGPPVEGVPALVLWGGADTVFPPEGAAALAGRITGARVELFPAARHPCYLDDPERFHALLAAFAADALR